MSVFNGDVYVTMQIAFIMRVTSRDGVGVLLPIAAGITARTRDHIQRFICQPKEDPVHSLNNRSLFPH